MENYKGFFKIPGLDVMFLNGTSFEQVRLFKNDLTIEEYNLAIGKKVVKKSLKKDFEDKSLKKKFSDKSK